MENCPCCSNQMLRHVRQSNAYWFCRHCWQEMPAFSELETSKLFLKSSISYQAVPKLIRGLAGVKP